MNEISNSDSMLPCGCRSYLPAGKIMHEIVLCDDHSATGETMQALRAELAELRLWKSQSIQRNLQLREQYHEAERFIEALTGVFREALNRLPEDSSTYHNVVNAIVNAEKRNKKKEL